jgi:integrase
MGRKRTAAVMLPEGVQQVLKKDTGRLYFYYAPKRGTKAAGKRVPLGSDTKDPEFWRRYREASGGTSKAGSLSELMSKYRQHTDFTNLRPASQRGYNHFLDRLEAIAGDRQVSAMTRRDVYALLDNMSATPVAANFMLAVLRTLLEWGVPRGYRDDNPAVGVKRLKVEDSGHAPWPEPGYAFVMEHAPTHLCRLAFLGRATGQRVSDLVRMRAIDLAEDGVSLRIGKLRDKPHLVPLTKAQMSEIRSWGVRDLECFITTPGGKRCSAAYINTLWNSWRSLEQAAKIRDLKMTIHGLRATSINDRRREGTEDGGIADELGMSVKMVSRYLRFADKVASGRASRDRREQKMTEFENSRRV